MARASRTDARSQAALALLRSGLVAAAIMATGPARTAGAQGGPHAPAGADSLALLAQAAESGTASPSVQSGPARTLTPDGAQLLEPGTGFTLRRVANPRYRSFSLPDALSPGRLGKLIGTEYARVQITRRESGPAFNSTDWDVVAGRDNGANHGIELSASGYSSPAYDELRTLRLISRQGPLEWSVGDVVPQSIGTLPWIQRLRGGMVSHALQHGSDWRVLGGVVPTLSHLVSPDAGLGGVMIDNLPFERNWLSLGLIGFGRRASPGGAGHWYGPDTLAGAGGAALYAARISSGYGEVSSTFMAQVHNLDGSVALAGLQALEWSLERPSVVASVRDQVGTSNARQPGTDRLIPAPRHEGRVNAQLRLINGKAEAHLAGLTSSGTDPGLAAETAQIGVSGVVGASGWYTGLDFSWNRRAPTFDDERRISAQTGKVSEHGNAVLLRIERNSDNSGRDQFQFTGEASTSPLPGLRVSLEPRLDWQARMFDRAMWSARFDWPLVIPSIRMNASVTVTSARARSFHNELSEASVGLSFSPRQRDRASFEARRYEDGGMRSFETTGSYDLLANRYSNPAGSTNAQGTGTLVVTVVHADSARGVPDALVSLDGKEFRFTDSEGVARFINTAAGSHVVSVVERSLPASQRIVGAATAFVTIERGRTPDPVRFEIARPVRRVRF